MINLWTEKYRPNSIEDYIFKNENHKKIINQWIGQKEIPHCLFTGPTGTGKTSIAKLLKKELDVLDGDWLEINASKQNNVETVKNKINNFISTWPLGKFKIVLLDEFDGFSKQAQKILRNDLEAYAKTARFIFTANYPENIIEAIKGRCQCLHFDALDKRTFANRAANILSKENVGFEVKDLAQYIEHSYPDMRSCINNLQKNSVDHEGKLTLLSFKKEELSQTKEWLNEAVRLINNKEFREARKLIVEQASVEEYTDIYRWLWTNLSLWGDDDTAQDKAIIVINKGLLNHADCAIPELNLTATITELLKIKTAK